MIHFAEREARERKAHASSGPIVTLSSVIEAFFWHSLYAGTE
nr:hypothetical protein [Escherichia coli]